MQAVEVHFASLHLLLQSISRRLSTWLVGGFHLFVICIPFIDDFRRPSATVRFLTVQKVVPIIGALCIPGSSRQALTLTGCVDLAMHDIVWLCLVYGIYPKTSDLWAVRLLTKLAASRTGFAALWIYLIGLVLTKGAILYRIFQLGGYLRTKYTIATIMVRRTLNDNLEWLQRKRTTLGQGTQSLAIELCRQGLIHAVITGLLKLLVNSTFKLLYVSVLSCQAAWWIFSIKSGRLKHIEWNARATPLQRWNDEAPALKCVPLGTPHYVYTELPNDEKTIRLLLLHPRSHTGLIRTSLIRSTIDDAPRFVAVSYTWGSSERPATILVDGKAFKITSNAFNLLRDLSSPVFPQILWIDSICIDQSSVTEKTHQVQLMSAIYRRAFQVTVWLNHPFITESDSTEAKYQAAIDATHAYDLVYKLSLLEMLSLPRAAGLNLAMSPGGITRKMRPLTRLMQNPWFERIWVVQEVVLARTIRVVYAGVEMDWDALVTGLVLLLSKHELASLSLIHEDPEGELLTLMGVEKMSCLGVMSIFKTKHAKEGLINVGDALQTSGSFKATDLRDHVFGLTGLCEKDTDGWMTADYTLESRDVFMRASLRLIQDEGYVRAISVAGVGFHSDTTPGIGDLPSWVPDWSRKKLNPLSDPTTEAPYVAGGNPGRATRHWHCGPRLYLFGHVFDEVAHLCPVLKPSIGTDQGINKFEALQEVLYSIIGTLFVMRLSPLVDEVYPYPDSPVPHFEAFWRVLIGDRTTDTRPAPQSLGRSCIRWIRALQDLVDQYETLAGLGDGVETSSDMVQNYLAGMEFEKCLKFIGGGRRVAITKKGYIGLFPPLTDVGDAVCVVEGAPAPFALRPVDSREPRRYRLVGETFLLGIMDGEALPSAELLSILPIV
ncbi:HET-domain-containing protein [Coniochaeta sp. PMI_546]|nr:HET-domain-containing protein [Coniochaeta sp. PMI_546]